METKETIIFEVDVTSYEKSLALLTNSINALKADQKAYLEDSKKGIAGAAEAYEKVTVQLKNQQQAYRTTQAALQGYVAGQKSGVQTANLLNNSIQQNRDLLKQLTAQYINTKNPSEAFTKQIKAVSDALKQQEGVIGDTRRNVGNYFNEFAGNLPVIGKVVTGVKDMGLAFQTAGGGVKGFGAALATTGLPIIITGVTALVDIFKAYEPVAEAVERTTAGISAAFSALVRGNDIFEAGEQTAKLTGQLQELEDQQSLFDLNRQKSRKEVIALLLESKNTGISLGEQLQATIKANKLEKEENDKQLENLRKQADLEEEVFAVKVGIRQKYTKEYGDLLIRQLVDTDDYRNENLKQQLGITSDEINELRKRRGAIIETEGESQNLQDRLANRTAAIIEKINAARAKDLEEQKKQSAEADKIRESNAKKELDNARLVGEENEKIRLDFEKRKQDEILAQAEFNKRQNEQKLTDEKDFLSKQNEQAISYLEERTRAEKQAAEATKQAELEKQQYQRASLQAASSISDNIIGLVGDVAEAQGAGAEFAKALAFVQILTQQAIAIATAVTGGTESGAATGPAAIVSIPAFIATLVGTVTAVIGGAFSLLASPTPKAKFALGGEAIDVGGKSHAQGGTKYYGEDGNSFEVERGEKMFVMKADASRDIAKLSSWNQKYGGNSWTGSPVRYAAAGGVIGNAGFDTRQVSTSALQRAEMTLAIKEAMLSAPAPVVSVKEFNKVNSGVQRSVRVSEV
jgi:hypothetical protein